MSLVWSNKPEKYKKSFFSVEIFEADKIKTKKSLLLYEFDTLLFVSNNKFLFP